MVIFLAHSYLHELIYVLIKCILIKRIYFTTRETGCWKIYGLCCSLLMCGQNLLIGLKKMQYIVKSNFHSSLRHVRSKSFVCRHKFDRNNCKVSKNYVIYVLVNPIPGFCWTLHFFLTSVLSNILPRRLKGKERLKKWFEFYFRIIIFFFFIFIFFFFFFEKIFF